MARNDSTWHVTVVKLAILLAFAAAGCDRGPATSSQDGAEIYQRICATCHGTDGKPTAAMKARLAVRDLSSGEFRGRVTPVLVEAQVRTGSKNKLMPALAGALTDEQIAAVAAYVASPAFVKH